MATGAKLPIVSKEVRDEQRELDEHLDRVDRLFREHRVGTTSGAVRLLEALDELSEHLGMMFALKECDGYLREVVETAPSLCRCADELRSDHQALFTELSHLIDLCDHDIERHRWQRSWRMAEMTFENFRQRLEAHQLGEADLLQRAFMDDVDRMPFDRIAGEQ
ncbi:MAG TPA: hypothetical protein VFI31_02225 [Pirellulales bacterium]|nr:hypothetical protein [Pirellulales bacterium]